MLAPATKDPLSSVGMTAAPIEVRNLTVAYGGQPAILDINWTSPKSALVAVVGPNGAGKTTLLRAILGLVPVASGEIRIDGNPIETARGRMAYVPQRSAVDWDFPATALDVVTMGLYRKIGWLRPVRRADREAARAHLATVGLADLADRQIGALSGGQQQRVFLARALAQQARIYLLDEPFAGVDATTEKVMIDVLRKLRDGGALCVCVHHDLGTVTEIYDHVLLLHRQLIASGPTGTTFTPELIGRTYGVPLTAGAAAKP
jgi:manganese/zinc/iron transport system ATP- binding protein